MKSELIVDVQPQEVSIALLEEGRLVSLQKESRNLAYAVGDIYVAKVKKLMPGLNAAFVNVGYEKDAFLHYLDLGPHFSSYSDFLHQLLDDPKAPMPQLQKMKLLPDIDKHGSVSQQLTAGQQLLVQIVKEPISSKGPRLTTEISFTGRYMVLIPFSSKISISQKIKSTAEKLRLRHLVDSIRPKNFGVIVRTSAEGKTVAELNHEIQTLRKCWEDTVEKARTAEVPSLIFEEESRIVGVLRDVFSPSFENIHVNDKEAFSQILKYVSLIAPDKKEIVKLYDKDTPIFDTFNITKQIKSSFGKTVSFKSGAYIIIEHTEALHVIDVNSGNRAKAGNDQETNALDVNLRAADEIARQLRLRDMGGIIVIDFIDMNKAEHRQALYDHMRQVMATDRARHNILPLSKFGLMQITRQRVRPALDIVTSETCPSCFGKGEVQPSLLFTDTLHEKLAYLIRELQVKDFILYVHPFVDAYLKKGLISIYRRWRLELGGKFKVVADQSLAYLQYKVVDAKRNEIDLKEEKDLDKTSSEKTKSKAKNRVEQPADPE
jgi:ribonuclease G